MTYKNCRIFRSRFADHRYVWDELTFGQESEDAFDTVEAAKADIDATFGDAPAVVMGADNEITQN